MGRKQVAVKRIRPTEPAPSSSSSDDDSDGPKSSDFAIKPRDNSSKRKKDDSEETMNKKQKSAAAGSSRVVKKGKPIQIWSDDDEIALLRGTVDFLKINGGEPSGVLFVDFIMTNVELNFELSRSQLTKKMYRLRKKYESNVEKSASDPVIQNEIAFQLSKEIWGNTEIDEGKTKLVDESTDNDKGNAEVDKGETEVANENTDDNNNNNKGNAEVDKGKSKVVNENTDNNNKGNAEVDKGKTKVGSENTDNNKGNAEVDKGKSKVVNENDDEEGKRGSVSIFPRSVGNLNEWKNFIEERISKGDEQGKELRKKLRVLREKELVLELKKIDLLKIERELELKALQSTGC